MAVKNNKEFFTTCDRCKRTYHSYSVANCNHEAVNSHYGKNICLYCCMKCNHHQKMPNFGGVRCTLNL